MSKIVGSDRVKRGMAEMQKGGVIMDVVNAEQARIAEEAVNVPRVWSNLSAKYLPPITSTFCAAPLVSVPVPTNNLSPRLAVVPVP